MVLIIEVNNLAGALTGSKLVKPTIEAAIVWLRKNKKNLLPSNLTLSVAILKKEEMARKNEQFKKKLGATDVLSFVYQRSVELIEGEILFCEEIIKRNARKDGVAFRTEFQKNIIHGLLHILGMKHGKEMFALQDRLLKEVPTKQAK